MGRRQLLIVLPVMAVLMLAGALMILAPDASPLAWFGDKRKDTSSQNPTIAKDTTPGAAEESAPGPAQPAQGDPDKPGAFEEAIRAEAERIKAERARSPDPGIEVGKDPAAGPRARDPNPPPQPGEAPPATPTDPKQAERERRINQLRQIRRPPNQTLGNARPQTRKLSNPVGSKPLDGVSKQILQDRRGLYARYYAFTRSPIEDLLDPDQPTLDQRTPDLTRIDQRVYFESKADWADLPFDLTNFMGVWEGFLVIEKTGDYWLYAGADWTMRVVIAGDTVLLNDIRDYTEVSTVITLEAGLHPLRIEYMEGKNGSVIDPMGACNFMYVPEGAAKPVPVPPEMLLLPESLWSNAAPIITRLSKTEGDVGDELTIIGQHLYDEPVKGPDGTAQVANSLTTVFFSGQLASVLDYSPSSLKVKVPVGAITGKVIVQKLQNALTGGKVPIPSNSVDFKVTTQFGLFAGWHDLQGWSNYDFLEPGSREPDVLRLEREFMFDQRSNLDLPFKNQPLACRWEGKFGVPADWAVDGARLVRFQANGRLRVTLGEQTRGTEGGMGDGNAQTILDFEVPKGAERYLPLTIDFTAEGAGAALRVVEMKPGKQPNPDGSPMWEEVRVLPYQYFFPPVVPPRAPRILSVRAYVPEGETPAPLPYVPHTSLPSVREGQDFDFELEVTGDAEVQAADVLLLVDGKPVTYSVESVVQANATTQRRKCRGVLPNGLGEGRMVARLTIVTSEPFYIDVTNKGLITYLYDLPNPGGYSKMPELEPLICFEVRKERWVNFENANDFNLPFPAETFAVAWYGALIVEEEGDYVFTGRSDDGILVWLDSNLVLEDDNLHYQREKSSAPIRLTPGVYPFRMEFFENNVHEVCVLYWEMKRDDQTLIPKQVIPKKHWTWDVTPPLPQKTGTGKRTDGSDPQ
ncbi:MAG: hypothetical protein KF696_01500 [Planctomycetes bacterium]|nr:hypothetical protein [Planctomycetota bacterium]MCW8134384.1 hypothetical protein [Planctomycetota bacterium]